MSFAGWSRRSVGLRWLRFLTVILAAGLLLVAGMEIIYRLQLVDCYRGELEANNFQQDLEDGNRKQTLLIMGDSFAARPDAFAFDLRRALSKDWRTINSAVSGTGIVQAGLMAKRRFRRFHPRIFLYQIYVGNDLFDLRYPAGWGRVSVGRSLYWLAATPLRSLAWLNYKLAQVRAAPVLPPQKRSQGTYREEQDVFSPQRFTLRDRIYARAEPGMVEDSVLLRGRRRRDFQHYLGLLDELLATCGSDDCRVVLLVIPHFAQIGPEQAERARKIGFRIPENGDFFNPDYPFIRALKAHLLRCRPDALLINPLEAFQLEGKAGRVLYYRNDSHLNPVGQHLLAEKVLERMCAAGLVREETEGP